MQNTGNTADMGNVLHIIFAKSDFLAALARLNKCASAFMVKHGMAFSQSLLLCNLLRSLCLNTRHLTNVKNLIVCSVAASLVFDGFTSNKHSRKS